MKILKGTVFVVFLLVSCTNIISITKNEDKGIKDILDAYGGYCAYSIGVSYSTNEGSGKFFELKLSKSKNMEQFSETPEVPATYMAYTFYKNLGSENKKYSSIHCVLMLDKKREYKAEYSTEQLALISEKMRVLYKVIDLIKAKNFSVLRPMLSDETYKNANKDTLLSNLQTIDDKFGKVKGFTLAGFRYETLNGFNVLHIIGLIERDKQTNQFSLSVDLKPNEDKIHYLDYTYALK